MLFGFAPYYIALLGLAYIVTLLIFSKSLLRLLVEFSIGGNAHCINCFVTIGISTLYYSVKDMFTSLFHKKLLIIVFLFNLSFLFLLSSSSSSKLRSTLKSAAYFCSVLLILVFSYFCSCIKFPCLAAVLTNCSLTDYVDY